LSSPKRCIRSALLTFFISLAGCGFQLVGFEAGDLKSVHLVGLNAAPLTSRIFRQALEERGTTIVPFEEEVISVHLHDERSFLRSFATTNVQSTAEYELRLELDFSILKGENILLEDATLISHRYHDVDPNNLSASQEEQDLLLFEMRVNLAEQLIRRIHFFAGQTP
jgi:LPS-assembly lipoprotein